MSAADALTTRFAVIIVNFGSSDLLQQNAVGLELPPSGRLVVVDCFSDLAERDRVRALAERCDWDAVLLDGNRGFGGGMNLGAAAALGNGAEVLVALNPDARIDRVSLARLVEAVAADERLLASPTILQGDGDVWFQGADLYLEDGSVRGARARPLREGQARREWATGACFAISARLWTALAGFDEDYFLYWEDIDLSHRALDLGARLAIVDATVIHDSGGTQEAVSSARGKSEQYYYFNIRNRLLYATKHLDAPAVRRWQRGAVRVAVDVLLRGGRRQLVTSVQPWRALLRGCRDGGRIVRNGGLQAIAPRKATAAASQR